MHAGRADIRRLLQHGSDMLVQSLADHRDDPVPATTPDEPNGPPVVVGSACST